MSEYLVTAQHQIFHEPLDSAELATVNSLVNRHKANAALTQQLALDASRLITTSQERLAKQSGAGFCKRFVSTISGKTSEIQLLNQTDMLQMQKFAWHYLQQLQQQNLINSQSIAVIRNNLGTMNEYIIETRDFLEQVIDKIDSRLRHVENNTSFNNWSLHIEANKRRFKSIPKTLLVLRLTYDFMQSHQDVALTARDINHLVVTLEKFGINCDENIKLLDFIIELIDQVEISGIAHYRDMINLSFGEHVIESHFIQKNISGIGFNALHFLSEQYEKIINLISDSDICKSDEDREKIISKFFGDEFSGLSTTYSIRDLVGETIGGSLVSIEIYKEVNGLNVMPNEVTEESQPDVIVLISSLPDIHAHTFLDGNESVESRRNYLRLLALCVENSASLGKPALEFIELLAEKAGHPELCEEILILADNPNKYHEYMPLMQKLLDDGDKLYTWLLDSFFLLTLSQRKIENPQIMRIIGILKPVQLREVLPNLLAIINEKDESQVLETAAKLVKHTHGWKNIIRYRSLRFDQFFAATVKNLHSAGIGSSQLNLELLPVSSKASEYSYFSDFFNDGILSKVGSAVSSSAYAIGRKSALSSLNEIRKKAINFISENSSALQQANRLISRWNIPSIEFKNTIDLSDFELNNSASNEDWHHQFEHHERKIESTLTSFSEACTDANSQIELFAGGEFDQSILKIKAQKRTDWLLQKKREKQAKQSVGIVKDGREQLFSIEWHQVKNPPCDPEKIRHIKTDGKIWLIVDNDEVFYRSEDRANWQQVQLTTSDTRVHVRKIDIVNGMWVIVAGYSEGFYHSSDARTWRQTCLPESLNVYSLSPTDNIVHCDDLWLWQFKQNQGYQYTEKGIFFDSTKTSYYKKTILFCAKTPDGPWQRWDSAPGLSEGVEVECIRSLPGTTSLLVFCKYDYLYTKNKKKVNTESYVRYYIPGKDWRDCTWGSADDNYSDTITTRMGSSLMCFYSNHLLVSERGYEWKNHGAKIHVENFFHLKNLSLFTSKRNSELIYLSQDAEMFSEIILEEGRWQHFAANEQGALGVYSPNNHETFLRIGHYIYQDKI